MRLKQEQVDKLSKLIFNQLKTKDLIRSKHPDSVVQKKIGDVILRDLGAEDNLEAEARKLLDQYRPQIEAGVLDEHKALQMIKKQLAKDKKIIL